MSILSIHKLSLLETLRLSFHLPQGVADCDRLWLHAVSTISSLPEPSSLTRIQLLIGASISPSLDSFDAQREPCPISDASWDAFIHPLKRHNNLADVDFSVGLVPTLVKRGSKNHPAVVRFFKRNTDELFPLDRKYTVALEVCN